MKTKTLPRRVDFQNEPTDRAVVKYAAYGLSLSAIARKTGLSPGQVMYRYRVKAKITLTDWRDNGARMVDRIEDDLRRTDEILSHLRSGNGSTR